MSHAAPTVDGADVRPPDTGRIIGYDLARTVALVGMMLSHLFVDDSAVQSVVAGRSSALFAVLAGVSLGLVSGRTRPVTGAERATARGRITVRALGVALLGLILGGLDSGVAVILVVYGVLFLLALPFLGLRAPALLAWATGWILLSPVALMLLLPRLPATGYAVPGPASITEPLTLLADLFVTGYYPALVWLGYLLLGLAIARMDLRSPLRQVWLLLAGVALAAVAYVVSSRLVSSPDIRADLARGYDRPPSLATGGLDGALAAGQYGTPPREGSWWWLGVWSPHTSSIADVAHTAGTALAVIALCLVLTGLGGRLGRRAWTLVAGAGAIPLTSYTLHIVLMTLSRSDAVSLPAVTDPAGQLVLVLGFGLVLAAFGVRGPLESALRGLAVAFVPGRTPS